MSQGSGSLSSLRVLLVDDSQAIQRLMKHILKNLGIDVVTAMDGRQGIAAVLWNQRSKRDFDIIFMDIDMPKMDGHSVTRALRERGHKGPIVALSARGMPFDRQKALDAGCNDYLTKPINRPHLLSVINQFARSTGDAKGN